MNKLKFKRFRFKLCLFFYYRVIKINNLFSKSDYKWSFKPDDWFLSIVLSNDEIRNQIFIIKNYNFSKINTIVFNIYNLVKEERVKRENASKAFIDKKNYLIKNKNNNKIQLTLEDEYAIKELIERYKSFELIGWIHLGKNDKIFRYCVMQKQEILIKLYQLLDTTIRKVIGSKVINPLKAEFEEAVDFAWTQIINYLTKIDTSRVMFSIFVSLSQQAAINYNKKYVLPHKYNEVCITDLNLNNNGEDIDDDTFINTVVSNDVNNTFNISTENNDFEPNDGYKNNIDCLLEDIDNNNKIDVLQQNVLAHSYNILSGKIKHLCFEKIFAEFFADLIQSNISDKILEKYTPTILDIMNSITDNTSISLKSSESNEIVYKLFKDWIKDKINNKLSKFNINKNDDDKKIDNLIGRENKILEYIKSNKNVIFEKLLEYKNSCNNFSMFTA
jgi:hypothetical protein